MIKKKGTEGPIKSKIGTGFMNKEEYGRVDKKIENLTSHSQRIYCLWEKEGKNLFFYYSGSFPENGRKKKY